MKCQRCPNNLTGKQTKFCSPRCSKLYLKSEWRKRNRPSVNAYARAYRAKGSRHLNRKLRARLIAARGGKCERCATPGNTENLDTHHIRPLRLAGTNEHRNLLVFCKPCHKEWHKQFDNRFWEPPGVK